jgi:hypothetical protein
LQLLKTITFDVFFQAYMNKVKGDESYNKMRTRSLDTEIVFYLSPSKSISDSLKQVQSGLVIRNLYGLALKFRKRDLLKVHVEIVKLYTEVMNSANRKRVKP